MPTLPTSMHYASPHRHGRKGGNCVKRLMRKYEVTPQKLFAWSCFVGSFLFLLHHFLSWRVWSASGAAPLEAFRVADPHATILVEGGRIGIVAREATARVGKTRTGSDAMEGFFRERLRQQTDQAAAAAGTHAATRAVTFTPIGQRSSIPLNKLAAATQNDAVNKAGAVSTETPMNGVASPAGPKSGPSETPSAVLLQDPKAPVPPSASPTTTLASTPLAPVTPPPVAPPPPAASTTQHADGSLTTKVVVPAATVSDVSFTSLTSPKKPLAASIDPSRLYDSPERRAARDAALDPTKEVPLPVSVQKRQVNNDVFPGNGLEKPLNEEWRETIKERRKQVVKAPGIVTSFTSPDGGLEMSLFLDGEGRVGYSMSMRASFSSLAKQMKADGEITSLDEVDGPFLLPALLDLSIDSKLCLFDTKTSPGQAVVNVRLSKGFSFWHPVPKAERSEYGESFTQITLWNDDAATSPCGSFIYEFRLFNIGFGARAIVQPMSRAPTPTPNEYPEEGEFVSVVWSLGLRLQDGATESRCVANNYEEPFVLLACRAMADAMMTPVTVEISKRIKGDNLKHAGKHSRGPSHMALVQAAGPAFVRSTAVAAPVDEKRPGQTQLFLVTRGEAPVKPSSPDLVGVIASPLDGTPFVTPTSWHVVLFGAGLRHLPHASHLTPLLCDPPTPSRPDFVDSRWVPTGKLMRITKFTTDQSRTVVDWAATHNFPLVHFDAGWYGNEYLKTSSAKQVLPAFQPQLNMTAVTSYAHAHGIRVCLYINELALRDTADLTRIYAEWGINGVKFGFVEVDDPRAMRILHQRILAFGSAGMFINVHDSYRPRGLTRTFPFLVAQEGVRGEERTPDALHHTLLPFVRLLQGSADYTPRYLAGSMLHCTKAHQLSLPLLVYSPIQSLFWAEPIGPVSSSVQDWNKELVIWTRMPSVWDDTRFLLGSIGESAAVARRDARAWYVAVITNTKERKQQIDLNQLWHDEHGHPKLPPQPLQEGYLVHLYKDSPWKERHDPFGVKVQPREFLWLQPPKELWIDGKEPHPPRPGLGIIPDGVFSLDLAPSGGTTLYLTPATPEALKEVP